MLLNFPRLLHGVRDYDFDSEEFHQCFDQDSLYFQCVFKDVQCG